MTQLDYSHVKYVQEKIRYYETINDPVFNINLFHGLRGTKSK